MKSHEGHTPSVLNTTVSQEDAYATNDLLVPHPTNPDLWKVFGEFIIPFGAYPIKSQISTQGRADDQIMLSTGEKVRLCKIYNHLYNHIE